MSQRLGISITKLHGSAFLEIFDVERCCARQKLPLLPCRNVENLNRGKLSVGSTVFRAPASWRADFLAEWERLVKRGVHTGSYLHY
jgi:hypothetical protein